MAKNKTEKSQVVPKTTVTKGIEIAIGQRYVAGQDVESIARSFKIYANRVRRILNKNEYVGVLLRNIKPKR